MRYSPETLPLFQPPSSFIGPPNQAKPGLISKAYRHLTGGLVLGLVDSGWGRGGDSSLQRVG